jgi:hypothetical protein
LLKVKGVGKSRCQGLNEVKPPKAARSVLDSIVTPSDYNLTATEKEKQLFVKTDTKIEKKKTYTLKKMALLSQSINFSC